jgi:hypothetical protein
MARCEEVGRPIIGLHRRKSLFHRWQEWGKPQQATYRGILTLVQIRECLYCKKVQVKAL